MLRHFLIAALRNMAANRLLTAISILGLAVGMTGAILMGLVVRNQLTYDHFIPGYERTYMAVSALSAAERPVSYDFQTNRQIAGLLKLNAPEIENAGRLIADRKTFQHGALKTNETLYWADANIFAVLPLPVFQGNLKTALSRPDGVVLTRDMARKYFGRDDVVGQAITIEDHPFQIRAVVENMPENGTQLQIGTNTLFGGIGLIFASGASSLSPLATPEPPDAFLISARTYIRLVPGVNIGSVQRRSDAIIARLWHKIPGVSYAQPLMRIDRVNLFASLNPDAQGRLMASILVGVLALFIAAINFVNLAVARSARRGLEVGVRKACGAGREALVLQFLGEAVIIAALAALIAMALSELLLPSLNDFYETGAAFDYWRDPEMIPALLAAVTLVGLAAGAYPAFLLSRFRPAATLKGAALSAPEAGIGRNMLVILQFAVLTALIIAAGVVYQQRIFAIHRVMGLPVGRTLVINTPCATAVRTEIQKLPGVSGIACTSTNFFNGESFFSAKWHGESITTYVTPTQMGIFGLYGIKPMAGSLVAPVLASDAVVNETLVRRYHFASPAAAIGQVIPYKRRNVLAPVRIIAVVPDFSLHDVSLTIKPTIYAPPPAPERLGEVNVKLTGQDVPGTMAAMDRIWARTGHSDILDGFFVDEYINRRYGGLLREAQLFTIFAAVAVFLACLGLFGLSTATAESRVKEIGVRKAMGATTGEIVALLLWQFSRPVLWANVIAWPLAWWAMDRWLNGFAYHVPLSPWLFPAAGTATLLIALLTVAGQTMLTARQRPVLALRYE